MTKRSRRRSSRLPRDRSERRLLRRFLVASSLFIFLMLVVGVIATWGAYNAIALPPEVPLAQTTTVTDASGKQLAVFNDGENRVPVKLGDVPPVVIQAILDTEDHNYYEHHGVDPRGIARALYVDLRSGANVQGGSTITQQYVKQTYVGTERSVSRKVKEAILAVKLEQRESKDEVLERYLNTIYWGRGAYGIQTASRAYFGKDVQQLGLQEAAYLAGLIRAPETADAYKHPEVANQRRALTLGNMVRFGHISPQQEADVNAIPLTKYVVQKASTPVNVQSTAKGAEYFVEYVKKQLIARYGERLVQSGGLKVKTTLDATLQTKAYDSVYGFLKPGEPAGALVSLDQNGYVKAMVGGRDYKASEVNLAIGAAGGGSGRQAGSTFKPFGLASAIENGECYRETYRGPGTMQLPGWDPNDPDKTVKNFGNQSFGNIDLIEATENSVNTVYAQLVMKHSPESLVSVAKKAGITSKLQPNNSIVLGVDSVSPLELAASYLTFSQQGVRVTPNPILEVKNAEGQTLERAQPKRERVMDANTADVVNLALSQVVSGGSGRAANIGKPVAGKTGTTEDNADAWFVGYTPKLATAVWMGYPEGNSRKMTNVRGITVTGGSFPAQIFSSYMRVATAGDKAVDFEEPEPCVPKNRPTTTTTDDFFGGLNDDFESELENLDEVNPQAGNRRGNNRNNGNGGNGGNANDGRGRNGGIVGPVVTIDPGVGGGGVLGRSEEGRVEDVASGPLGLGPA